MSFLCLHPSAVEPSDGNAGSECFYITFPAGRGKVSMLLTGDVEGAGEQHLLAQLRKYQVTDEYDYRKNSIYKTFLACDSVSDEVLLHNHYRCNEKIIGENGIRLVLRRVLT